MTRTDSNPEVEQQPIAEQVNIQQHSKTEFEAMVDNAFLSGGMGLTAMKSWGKSRFLFSCCRYLRSQGVKTLIFDVSDAWLYGFDRIPVFNITDNDITIQEQKQSIDIEKYSFNNWKLVRLALSTEKDLLIRLKIKSKREFAIRTIINYLDDIQRAEKEQTPTHENKNRIAYFIDEPLISNRATSLKESEEFLSTFREGRNFSEAFFTSQQLSTSTSKQLRDLQIDALGKLNESQKMPYHRKLEKLYKINLSTMKERTWLIEGKVITAPTWTQKGKPYIINQAVRQKWFSAKQPTAKPKMGFWKALAITVFGDADQYIKRYPEQYNQQSEQQIEESLDDNSEYDGAISLDDDDILLPSDNPQET